MSRYDNWVPLRDAIKKHALDLGFDLVGIAPASPGKDLEFARQWVERGYAGEMAYLSNPKRFDPGAVLPGVQSVICVGLIYDTPFPYSTEVAEAGFRIQDSGAREQKAGGRKQESGVRSQKSEQYGKPNSTPPPSPSGRGWSPPQRGTGEGEEARFSDFDLRISPAETPRAWISRYAWGRDYHEIMREKLEKLRAAIEELSPGAETRVFVDTGPVNERAYARWSGLGWMGKNTCIINEEKGSWFFLGVILTNLALEPDLPAPDRCGSCRACLDACPTGALVEPYVMDASRCISYLTIELKGSIPPEFRSGIGANIFGCDICQDVCPWNGKSRIQESGARSQESGFGPMSVSIQPSEVSNPQPSNFQSSIFNHQSPSPQLPESSTFSLFNPPLEDLASMTEDDFRQNFRHSPIKRTKYRGWLRNLCVAMGNSGDARLVPRLKELAAHPDPVVREHAEWALKQIHSREAPKP